MPWRRSEGLLALTAICLLALVMSNAELRPCFRCKAVITDVDGTLMPFGTNAKISKRNQEALTKALDVGMAVCVATGRIPGPWYDELCAQVPFGPGVFANGALILDASSQQPPKILAAWTLPRAAVAAVLGRTPGGRFRGLRVSVLAATLWEGSPRYVELAPEGPTWATELIRSAGEPEMVLLPTFEGLHQEVYKFVLFTTPQEEGWAAMADVRASLREDLEGTGVTVLDCGERHCEILPPGVNKGAGVQKLLELLGLSLDSALACGDAENDVEMLRMAGRGVAVGDAKPPAKEAADLLVAPSTEDGVAEAIDAVLE